MKFQRIFKEPSRVESEKKFVGKFRIRVRVRVSLWLGLGLGKGEG